MTPSRRRAQQIANCTEGGRKKKKWGQRIDQLPPCKCVPNTVENVRGDVLIQPVAKRDHEAPAQDCLACLLRNRAASKVSVMVEGWE